MIITNYTDADFDEVLRLMNQSCRFDRFTEPLLLENINSDPDFNSETCFVARENQQISGFMMGVIREIRGERIGYIKLMGVVPDSQRHGIATKLLARIESFFRKYRVSKLKIYDVPFNYFMPGIDPRYTPALCFAERNGFLRIGDTSNLIVDLEAQDWDTAEHENQLADQGIAISRVTETDRDELMRFIDDQFPLWRVELETAFRSDPIAIHIARQDDKIKAFSAHNGNNVGTGWFGPMGTHPDLRGKGIGGVLLKRCLKDTRDSGLNFSIIPWVGPIAFYSHYSGAVVDRVFWRYEKSLIK